MVTTKSLDEFQLIAAMLRDAQALSGVLSFNNRALQLTTEKVRARMNEEGTSFLTKASFAFGKHLDQVLSESEVLNPAKFRFATRPGTRLPIYLGELIETFITKDGVVSPSANANCVANVRQILLSFGKYELPYKTKLEDNVVSQFIKTESDLFELDSFFSTWNTWVETKQLSGHHLNLYPTGVFGLIDQDTPQDSKRLTQSVRVARILLQRVLSNFDYRDIVPRHGPGAVATKQRHSDKYRWTNVSRRITNLYPFDEYFCSSMGDVCDNHKRFKAIGDLDLPARVVLVPKDSRGPRLISCEPVDFQWIQQGLMRSLVSLIEAHPLTAGRVNFTDQNVNRGLALLASSAGDYVTLDLKEASDRVHIDLVRLLFPEDVFEHLSACRSLATELPSGEVIPLRKFAPMGSALCFPVMSLTIWALLSGAAPDAHTRNNVYVYGDDVIVPTAYAESAMAMLELFGLKINRSKSCTRGLFRESCGMDAFQGVCVTPVRYRTPWSVTPSPSAYTSWIEYSNSFHNKCWYYTSNLIAGGLRSIYGPIPDKDMSLSCPSLYVSDITTKSSFKSRWNKNLQKRQYLVRDITSPSHNENYPGWSKLLRYFTEGPGKPSRFVRDCKGSFSFYESSFDASLYTSPRTTKLVRRWR